MVTKLKSKSILFGMQAWMLVTTISSQKWYFSFNVVMDSYYFDGDLRCTAVNSMLHTECYGLPVITARTLLFF